MRLRIVVLRLNFRHIIFDLDGTLIDSAGDLVASSNHVLETLGLVRLPAETIIGFVGDGVRKLVERCLTEATGDVVPEARIARGLALLVEHYAGAFPPWLAPVQAVGIPVAERHAEYLYTLGQRLKGPG
ncbi:MAG: HAD hydrolase-like protein, partial [Dechloromonas sp.]|nr:HAD hydrolase-like protein [Dechloromonas sp.]